MTHPDADHIGGFVPVFDRYDVGAVIQSFVKSDSGLYTKVQNKIKEEEGARVFPVITDTGTFTLDGMQFDILWPIGESVKETNAASVILLITHGDIKIFLTGDAPAAVEDYVVAAFPERTDDIDILKAGHHGSKTSTSESFLEHTKPNAVIYSMGKNNNYGHPHEIIISRVGEHAKKYPDEKVREYRTSDGTVSFCLTEISFAEC